MSWHTTQRERIRELRRSANGAWVPLPEIMRLAARYNARLLELRRSGLTIENRTQELNGVKHSWYRLIESKIPPASGDLPLETSKEIAWEQRPRVATDRQGRPLLEPPAEDLPLFAGMCR